MNHNDETTSIETSDGENVVQVEHATGNITFLKNYTTVRKIRASGMKVTE